MNKRIPAMVCVIILCLAALLPFYTDAAGLVDPDAPASLTLYYRKDGKTFADLPVSIHRVARVFPDGTYELIAPYAAFPVNIHGITSQDHWKHVATTLSAYIVADQVAPYREARTDGDGTVKFTGLETGLYLVREVTAEHEDGTYVFNDFMIYLPTPGADGSIQYDMEAVPKCTAYTPKTQYSVTKLWQDGGDQTVRPEAVTVEIYLDGVLYDTRILNAANNWTYTWYASGDETGDWTVAERAVPEEYKVTIQQNGSAFSIVNTRPTEPDIPDTGDSMSPLPWILAICISGLLLLILGIYGWRHR